ncbi:carbohydrate deacetylase-like isoform X2 [Pecten maximus]|uniref:carbohydrate deacetylase-like isoform X2 n=1 Tax=Pecten maximus TaxID=6579 RepID=UPI0014589FD7|nr:carbohydrate deacetylase-like isoform X2 [Pecten maximus]
MMRKSLLVVNADDFGYSDERDDGIVECYRNGHISSVSLLVNGVRAENAAKLAKQNNMHLVTGLHVNLTEGQPIGQGYRTLIRNGCFLGKFGFREAVNEGQLDIIEVRREIQAQIDKFRELMGNEPYHADGHQHIHVIPGIVETFAAVLSENHVKVTRLPRERGVVSEVWATPQQAGFMKEVVHQSEHASKVFSSHKLWTCDEFIGLRTMGSNMTIDRVTSHLSEVYDITDSPEPDKRTDIAAGQERVVTCEWMVHPGHVTSGEGGCGEGPDDFSKSHDRQHEIDILSDKALVNVYRSMNITMTNFKDCFTTIKS